MHGFTFFVLFVGDDGAGPSPPPSNFSYAALPTLCQCGDPVPGLFDGWWPYLTKRNASLFILPLGLLDAVSSYAAVLSPVLPSKRNPWVLIFFILDTECLLSFFREMPGAGLL